MEISHQASIVGTIDAFGNCSYIIPDQSLYFDIRRNASLRETHNGRKDKEGEKYVFYSIQD